MKNVVVVSNFKKQEVNPPFVDNCIASWRVWCEKNGVLFFVNEEPMHPYDVMTAQMQKMYTLDCLIGNGVEFDQIAQVDYDTFVLPHCGNFFEMTNHEVGAVIDGGFGPQLNRQIRMCKDHWFPDSKINWDTYFNSGFMVYNKKHAPAFKGVIDFYWNEREKWLEANKSPDLTDDQTLINFYFEKCGFPITYLPRSYNILDPHNRYFLFEGSDNLGRYINATDTIRECCNIFHFCGDIEYRNNASTFLRERFL